MKLSEKIIALRSKHQMSQGDLAEKLNVSRQSVSKWETGASTPDLDKIIAMSELFHVTVDELVKETQELGKESTFKQENVVSNEYSEQQNKEGKIILRIVAGIILLCLAIIYYILSSLGFDSMGTMGTLVISGYVFLCGLICIFSKKKPVRTILIVTGVIVAVYALLIWIEYLARL